MLSVYGEQLCKALSLEITLIRKTLYVVAAARVTNSSAREGGMANRRTFLPCPDNNEHGPLALSSECCKMRVVDGTEPEGECSAVEISSASSIFLKTVRPI